MQTSSYGEMVPKVFGRMRVAGTVIWATDIQEDRHKEGGSKGSPKVTTYSYSARFAVALSARPIRAVHRIWAEGKLLRGSAGDFKSEIGAFRVHLGSPGQAVDPLIAAAEGIGATPAFRDYAYVVFEDLQLADFGNRIPSLTFEVEADEGPVSIGGMADALSGGALSGAGGPLIGGFAASGDSVRSALDGITRAAGLVLGDDGGALRLIDPRLAVERAIPADALGATAGKAEPRRRVERSGAGVPDEVDLSYYDPARDWLAGLQRARSGRAARTVETVELPAALDAGVARALAEDRLALAEAGRTTAAVRLGWAALPVAAGGCARIAGGAESWRVAGWALEDMVLALDLVALPPERTAPAAAAPGRAAGAADLQHGPTIVHLIDLPATGKAATVPRLWVAAAGPEAGWRRAALALSVDGGASWESVGATARPATMGTAAAVLAAGAAELFDLVNSVEVELLNDAMWLAGRDDAGLFGGANLILIGEELLQFGRAEQIGARRFRLSRLLRGRFGTEWAMADHAGGERVILIDAATMKPTALPEAAIGGTVRVSASGIGDAEAGATEAVYAARALRPPCPVHLRATIAADGRVSLGWTRRSRTGWAWRDAADAPLGEEAERYRVTLTPSAGVARVVETAAPSFDWTAAMRAADGAAGASSLTVGVVQLGTAASSLPPAMLTIAI
ncbi:phage tail protein [Sphingomonas sp. ID0503]|uniref:phage tail protein n=1 Tax=Sphingomonas sp. ID0503 TaxID=3399691 RepID=UPI003AFB3065